MSEERQIDVIIDLLTEFDEMGFVPTTTVPNPEAYAIKWRDELTKSLDGYRKQSRGEWVSVEGDVIFKCSICEAEISTSWDYENDNMFAYCPCCGAKMKGE